MSGDNNVRLLDDTPASEDAFGSHRRIADAIAQIVKGERGGRAIALVGTWGSGKSTVVKLLNQKLEANPQDFRLVSFDAWSHENDPLRRSFLENMIDSLLEPEPRWLDEKEWVKKRKELANKITTTRTKTGSKLTWTALVFSLMVFLTPIGYSLISAKDEWLTLGLWLAGLPAGIIGLAIIIGLIVCRYYNEWGPPQFLSTLVSDREAEKETEGTETPDPTSIEFQDKFQELLKDALQKHSNRHLIIVVDNLDRLDTHQALTIWATMRPSSNHRQQCWRLGWIECG